MARWIPYVGWVVVAMLLVGCEGASTPDSNVETFQTIQEVAAVRHAQQKKLWKETAVEVVVLERPDVKAEVVGDAFAIAVEAEGVRRVIDLEPTVEMLTAQPERSTEILRKHAEGELPAFDQDRLAAMSPERARGMVRPVLMSGAELDATESQLKARGEVPRNAVAPGLYWVPAVRWRAGGVATPVTSKALAAWKVEPAEIGAAALENIRGELQGDLFETTRFGPSGRVGMLKEGVEPAVMLLPEFLSKVREAWGMSDDLALLPATRESVRFLEGRNTALLDLIWPQYQRSVEEATHPLARRPLLLSEGGVEMMKYNPPVRITPVSTQPAPGLRRPATQPAKPQQRPYIVR